MPTASGQRNTIPPPRICLKLSRLTPARMIAIVAVMILLVPNPPPAIAQITLSGGLSPIIGIYFSAGSILAIAPWTTLTLGVTYTGILNIEPLVSIKFVRPLRDRWTLTLEATHGGLGGDVYRVDRLPEVRLTRQAPLFGSGLSYTLDFGVGNFRVWPGDLTAIRAHAGVQISTPPIVIGRTVTAGALVGYRRYYYFSPAQTAHSAWWTSAYVSWAPLPTVSTTLSYFRQEVSGTSPLLFDAMGRDHYVTGALALRLNPRITLTHTQTYSLVSNYISARVYGMNMALQDGQAVSVSWDDVPRTLSLAYSRSGLGTVGIAWTVPTNVWTIRFSR